MDDRRFDALTKLLGRRHSRRSVLVALAGTTAAAMTFRHDPSASASVSSQTAAVRGETTGAGVIDQYYLSVATYQYDQAYELLGADLQAQQPYDDFVAGYAETAYVQVGIGDVRTSGDHEDVQVTITAWHNDGSIHRFSGAYAVGEEEGEARILAATIREDEPPTDAPPLCRVADVSASFGRWEAGAGNRYGSLLVTNEGERICVAAGVPHLQVYDAEGTLLLESRTEQTEPIKSVPLRQSDAAVSDFHWANWCEDEPAYPLTLNIAIPGDEDRLTLTMESAEGPIQMPPCMGSGEPASFGARAFTPVEEVE